MNTPSSLTALGQDEFVGHKLVIVDEVVLDHVGPVAEAEDEVPVPEVGIVLHHVPQDGPVTKVHHGFEHRRRTTWANPTYSSMALVCTPEVFWALDKGDATIFERSPLEKIASQNRLVAFRHHGFWKCMDTLRDRTQLQTMWDEGRIAWRI